MLQGGRGAGALTLVGLHQARVGDGEGGGADADAAVGFFHDDGEDEARVDRGGGGDLEDGFVEVLGFGGGVVA